jgi:hypothetical protein
VTPRALLLVGTLLLLATLAHAQVLRVQTNNGTLTVASVLDCVNGVQCTCSSTSDGPECTIDGVAFEEEGQLNQTAITGNCPAAGYALTCTGPSAGTYTTPAPTATPAYAAIPAPTVLPTADCDTASEVGRAVVKGDGLDAQTLFICTDISHCLGGTNAGAVCANDSVCPSSTCSKFWCVAGANDGANCNSAGVAIQSICPGGTCLQYTYRRQSLRISQSTTPGFPCERLDMSADFSLVSPAGAARVCTMALGNTVLHEGDAIAPGSVPQNIQPTPDSYKLFGPSGSEIEVGFASQKRCRDGANAHATCSNDTACPGGTCVQVFWINNAALYEDDGVMVGDGGIRPAELSAAVASRTASWCIDSGSSVDLPSFPMTARLANQSQDRTIERICWRANATGATINIRRDGPVGPTPPLLTPTPPHPTPAYPTPSVVATPGYGQPDAGCLIGQALDWPKYASLAMSFTAGSGVKQTCVVVQYKLKP